MAPAREKQIYCPSKIYRGTVDLDFILVNGNWHLSWISDCPSNGRRRHRHQAWRWQKQLNMCFFLVIGYKSDYFGKDIYFQYFLLLDWLQMRYFLENIYFQYWLEPACGHMVAGRDSEKLVFFFRLVDVWLIFCGHSVCRKWAHENILFTFEIFSVDIKKNRILLFCGSLSVDIENSFWKYPLCRLNFFPWSFSVEIDKVSS